jgi:hypothetical protein
MDLA